MLGLRKTKFIVFVSCIFLFLLSLPRTGNSLVSWTSQNKKSRSTVRLPNELVKENPYLNVEPTLHKLTLTMVEAVSKEVSKEVAIEKSQPAPSIPVVINTWAFTEANKKAWTVLNNGGSALDTVEMGASACEELQCDYTVGYGGSPDENGETTLDAMIMDGETHAAGAVGCLRRVKNAVGVARKVMEHTGHTLLVGELATNFALAMGFQEEDLTTDVSAKMHSDWKAANCQPNFWRNVNPDPSNSCGPYSISKTPSESSLSVTNDNEVSSSKADLKKFKTKPQQLRKVDQFNHDTIGIVAIDSLGRIASATSSNGARNKIPGRVGDAPIVGAGSYVDKDIGGAAATGDGDVMVRFLPSLVAVENMRNGLSPQEAANEAIARIVKYYPGFSGALVAVNLKGEYGAACHGISQGFPYCVSNANNANNITVFTAPCT